MSEKTKETDATWVVIRQTRKNGLYYSAVLQRRDRTSVRCVVLGSLAGDPPTMILTNRLRALDPADEVLEEIADRVRRHADGRLRDEVVEEICRADDDKAALRATERLPKGWAAQAMRIRDEEIEAEVRRKLSAVLPDVRPEILRKPSNLNGSMTLERYVEDVWTSVRKANNAASTWDHEEWIWYKRIFPVLGEVRLIDLDSQKWSSFLATLPISGRSKALTQTAYRVALRHAADVLEWIPDVHKFARIKGSTLRTLPEPSR